MNKSEVIQEIIDVDLEIDRQFRQIESIYQDIKLDMARKAQWLKQLKETN